MNKQVLVLAAHPDDETLGCGATIAKLAKEGSNISLITFTNGVGARGDGQSNRNTKLELVCNVLGINRYAFADFPDNSMDSVPLLDICKFIEKNVQTNPDIIFTHNADCLNIDHQIVTRAALTVFRPQDGTSQKFLTYYVPSASEWNPLSSFRANYYYDVKDYYKIKMKALESYKNEMRPYPHPRSFENVENLMKVWGSEVGLEYAEKFHCLRDIIL